MNIRISKNQIRFRITQDELSELQANKELSLSVTLGAVNPQYIISLQRLNTPLALNIKQDLWQLVVDESALNEFAAALPSKEGIESEIQLENSSITAILEVDVRKKTKN